MSLFSSSENHLGIDIGNSGIKIVELQKKGSNFSLLTYGFADFSTLKATNWQEDLKFTSRVMNKILKDSGAVSKRAVAALPVFAVFSSVLNLAKVPKKEMEASIKREAAEIITRPIEEMVLDWKEMNGITGKDKKYFKIFITGAPKELVGQYVELFKEANIGLSSLEIESFSLIRSLLGKDKSDTLIVEIGASTTDIFVSSKGIPVLARSVDLAGNNISKELAKSLGNTIEEADQLKKDLGRAAAGEEETPEEIKKIIKPITDEIKYVIDLFSKQYNKKVEKIVLSGGSSLLPGIKKYFAESFNLNVVVGDPWARISYPQDLKPVLEELGPRLSVAAGLAMRGKS